MIWTLEEDAILLRLEPLLSRRAVAMVMARDPDAVNTRLSRLRAKHKKERLAAPPSLPKALKPRKCLSHGGYFVPERAGLFICQPCKYSTNWRDGQYMQDAV